MPPKSAAEILAEYRAVTAAAEAVRRATAELVPAARKDPLPPKSKKPAGQISDLARRLTGGAARKK